MKNFNIEELKRETPYKVPENFFAEMQENVLKNIGAQKKTPVYSLRRLSPIVAAASLLLAGGIGFLWTGENHGAVSPKNSISKTANTSAVLRAGSSISTEMAKVEEQADQPSAQQNKTGDNSPAVQQENSEKIEQQTETSAPIADNAAAEEDFDNALAKFTPEEIKQATENADKDVYLDLYN